MPTLVQRVAARYVTGADRLWEGALKALHAFNQKYEEAKRVDLSSDAGQKLLNEFAFRKNGTAPSFPDNPFHTWMTKAFAHTHEIDDPDAERPRGVMILQVVDGKLDERVFLNQLDKYADALRAVVNAVAPEQFSYFGFKVRNPDHIGEQLSRKTLEGVDYLVALFKKRGLTHLLGQGVKGIYLSTDLGGDTLGTYQSGTQTIALSTALVGMGVGRFMTWVNEAFLHEFGHYVHMNYISPDARKAWDQGWTEVTDKKDAYEKAFKAVTKSDRDRFFDLLMKAGWEPSRAAKSLDAVSRVKFGVWLRNPLVGDPLITDKQFRLTSGGQYVADFFRNTHAFMLSHYSVQPTDEDYLKEYQRVDRRMRDKLGLLWDGNFTIAPEVVAEMAKADPSMQRTVDEAIAKLDIVSDYGKTNEKEDFAETFVAFMDAPEKLTPTAKFRMQQALSLSALHGKHVMPLASVSDSARRVAARHLARKVG